MALVVESSKQGENSDHRRGGPACNVELGSEKLTPERAHRGQGRPARGGHRSDQESPRSRLPRSGLDATRPQNLLLFISFSHAAFVGGTWAHGIAALQTTCAVDLWML
jgi:hypothetical protein